MVDMIRLYKLWVSMVYRCTNPKSKDYKNYGGRGIVVCDAWKKFSNFASWALWVGYVDDLSIERIDNDSNYSPGNCTWIPSYKQAKNRRTTPYYTAFGETKSVHDWLSDSRCVVSRQILYSRIKQMNWNPEEAMTTPKFPVGHDRRKFPKTQDQH